MALFIGRGLKGDNKLNQNLHTLFPQRSTATDCRSELVSQGKVGRETGCHRRILMMNERDCLGPVKGFKVSLLSSNLVEKGLMFLLRQIWKSLFVPCASIMCVPSHNRRYVWFNEPSNFLSNKYSSIFEKTREVINQRLWRSFQTLRFKNHLSAGLLKSFLASCPSCTPPNKDDVEKWHLSLLCYQIYRYWSLFPLLHVFSQTNVLIFSVPLTKQAGSFVHSFYLDYELQPQLYELVRNQF